jgi:hypothetical protein
MFKNKLILGVIYFISLSLITSTSLAVDKKSIKKLKQKKHTITRLMNRSIYKCCW